MIPDQIIERLAAFQLKLFVKGKHGVEPAAPGYYLKISFLLGDWWLTSWTV